MLPQEIILELQNIRDTLDKYQYNELSKRVHDLIPFVPIVIYDSDQIPRLGSGFYQNPTLIFRARPNETLDKYSRELPWYNTSEISIVPDDKSSKIEYGRANKKYQARFYASNEWHVACYETIWHEFPLGIKRTDQNLTLGTWKIIQPLKLAFIPYSKKYIDRIRKPGQKIYDQIDRLILSDNIQIDKILQNSNTDIERDKFLIEFFSQEFAKLEIKFENDYFLSNYYCDQVFDNCPNESGVNDIDGIMYPSVCFSYQSNNIVIHPRSIHKLRFTEAMYVWVNYFQDTKDMQYIPLEQNIHSDNDGNIQWAKFKI
jgi:hypothetical protein